MSPWSGAASPSAPAEPVPPPTELTGGTSSTLDRMQEPLDLARQWAGKDRLGLIVSGSHAAGDAVWVAHEGRPVSLSDLDVFAVVRDGTAREAARARARAERDGLTGRLLAMGLAAPLEVGFHTPEDLAALPARPGTLELRRVGRVIDGDPGLLASVPEWSARDVSAEEVWLLLENRAFELLWAAHVAPARPETSDLLSGLKRRHAVLKVALELAAVMALSAGEYPAGAAARVAWARPRWDRARSSEPPWDAALAWREGRAAALAPAEAGEERLRTVIAWVSVWRRMAGDPGDPARPFGAIARVASRARWRRRLRHALRPEPREAGLGGASSRLRHLWAGTPRHRLHAAAAAHLIFEATSATRGTSSLEALERGYRQALRLLGFPLEPRQAADRLVRAWDLVACDGQRTGDWA